MQLSKETLATLNGKVHSVPTDALFALPEKVLQFGTGVLLRGLPDYFIDKANKKGIFNGRVVVVKSTDSGGTDGYSVQDGLYTHCISGIRQQKITEEYIINASISRVLSAKSQWQQILECASNPAMEIILSNTTEVGIVLVEEDKITNNPPVSFPGKLLAFLHERYKAFNGDAGKGMVIVPTELITDNGSKLQSIVIELAHRNNLDYTFIDWLENANIFCNSLVDRIVPGKLPAAQQKATEEKLGYTDELMIMSEPYSLWAIEASNPKVKEVLSFAQADEGVVITSDINKQRELKLRLLNGTHTFSCGIAFLSAFETVKEAMENKIISLYVYDLMHHEIAPCISNGKITLPEAREFAGNVLDRFRNPFIDHKWISITLNYSHKMRMRNIPLLLKHFEQDLYVPASMALGFAAYILFMKCEHGESGTYYGEANGVAYPIQDEQAGYFHQLWKNNKPADVVKKALSNEQLWGQDISTLPGFSFAVSSYLDAMMEDGVLATVKNYQLNRDKVESNEA
nr:tagaturonate reductase [uncultured Lacibacter sp.]